MGPIITSLYSLSRNQVKVNFSLFWRIQRELCFQNPEYSHKKIWGLLRYRYGEEITLYETYKTMKWQADFTEFEIGGYGTYYSTNVKDRFKRVPEPYRNN